MKNKLNKLFNILYSIPVLTGIVIAQPIIDIGTYFSKEIFNITSLGSLLRIILLVYALIYLLFSKSNKIKKISICYLIALGIFAVVNLAINFDKAYIFMDLKNIIKLLYFPIMLLFFIKYIIDTKKFITANTLNINTIIISTVTIIAKLTGSEVCSYGATCTRGFMGWFYSANEIGIICVLLYAVTLYIFFETKFSFLSTVSLIMILYTCLSIGTKASFLGVIVITTLMLIIEALSLIIKRKKEQVQETIMCVLMEIMVILLTPSTPVCFNNYMLFKDYGFYCKIPIDSKTTNVEDIKSSVEKEINDSQGLDKDDKVSEILNGRDSFKKDKDNLIKKKLKTNIFGLGYSSYAITNGKEKIIERDYYDLLYEYGYLGFILTLLPAVTMLLYLGFKRIKKISSILNRNNILLGAILLAFAGAHIAGHVLFAPAVTTYISLILAILFSEELKSNNETPRKK